MRTAKIGPDLRLIIIKLLLYFNLKGCFSVLKDFDLIIRVGINGHEKFTILHVPHIGFLCYSD